MRGFRKPPAAGPRKAKLDTLGASPGIAVTAALKFMLCFAHSAIPQPNDPVPDSLKLLKVVERRICMDFVVRAVSTLPKVTGSVVESKKWRLHEGYPAVDWSLVARLSVLVVGARAATGISTTGCGAATRAVSSAPILVCGRSSSHSR
ncbi:MAG: hypothetical protein K0Q61_330 [Rhodococcus erythropolis]|nr:hypothetical protein [Rhodococcus erythropolis]